mmetsp:Transcript_68949/g.191986  ORF Transcript_68949/g.191986 Transcript_68949/m.191986 type:complete len:753 (+) Transcript_68949:124-2382(+)
MRTSYSARNHVAGRSAKLATTGGGAHSAATIESSPPAHSTGVASVAFGGGAFVATAGATPSCGGAMSNTGLGGGGASLVTSRSAHMLRSARPPERMVSVPTSVSSAVRGSATPLASSSPPMPVTMAVASGTSSPFPHGPHTGSRQRYRRAEHVERAMSSAALPDELGVGSDVGGLDAQAQRALGVSPGEVVNRRERTLGAEMEDGLSSSHSSFPASATAAYPFAGSSSSLAGVSPQNQRSRHWLCAPPLALAPSAEGPDQSQRGHLACVARETLSGPVTQMAATSVSPRCLRAAPALQHAPGSAAARLAGSPRHDGPSLHSPPSRPRMVPASIQRRGAGDQLPSGGTASPPVQSLASSAAASTKPQRSSSPLSLHQPVALTPFSCTSGSASPSRGASGSSATAQGSSRGDNPQLHPQPNPRGASAVLPVQPASASKQQHQSSQQQHRLQQLLDQGAYPSTGVPNEDRFESELEPTERNGFIKRIEALEAKVIDSEGLVTKLSRQQARLDRLEVLARENEVLRAKVRGEQRRTDSDQRRISPPHKCHSSEQAGGGVASGVNSPPRGHPFPSGRQRYISGRFSPGAAGGAGIGRSDVASPREAPAVPRRGMTGGTGSTAAHHHGALPLSRGSDQSLARASATSSVALSKGRPVATEGGTGGSGGGLTAAERSSCGDVATSPRSSLPRRLVSSPALQESARSLGSEGVARQEQVVPRCELESRLKELELALGLQPGSGGRSGSEAELALPAQRPR